MQDRFKFRFFDKQKNKMMDCYSFSEFSTYASVPDGEITEFSCRPTENCELMQCTGLKDKNGRLIYENDIVKTLYTKPNGEVINRNCVVEFNRCAFWINYVIGASYLDNDDCIYEVIGNIYENPELLEAQC